MRSLLALGAAVIVAAPLDDPARAQDEGGFQSYLGELSRQAAAEGVSRRTIDAVIPSLTYNSRVVELDRQQHRRRSLRPDRQQRGDGADLFPRARFPLGLRESQQPRDGLRPGLQRR